MIRLWIWGTMVLGILSRGVVDGGNVSASVASECSQTLVGGTGSEHHGV